MRLVRGAAALAFVMTGACAAQPAHKPPPVEITSISYEVTSWGYRVYTWSIDANGGASFAALPERAPLSDPLVSRALTVKPADFQRVRETLADADRYVDRNADCSRSFTDAPTINMSWTYADGKKAGVSWYSGCLNGNAAFKAVSARSTAVDKVFLEVTKAR